MKNYKICEYVNPHGDKYYTISRRWMFVFWSTMKVVVDRSADWFYDTKHFDSYEAALKCIAEVERRNYKRVKCELV